VADGPTRAAFERMSRELYKVIDRQDAMARELEIQFQRIADVQADIDIIRAAWRKMKPRRPAKPGRAR
jgi:hypothetical protein